MKSLASRNENTMIESEDISVCCNMKAANFTLGTLEFCRVQQGMSLYWAERFNVLRLCQLINIHHITTFPEFCRIHSRSGRCFLRYSARLTDCITAWRWLDEKYNKVQKSLCVTLGTTGYRHHPSPVRPP